MAAKKKTTKKKATKKSAKKKLKASTRRPAKNKSARKKKAASRTSNVKKASARQSSGRRTAGTAQLESEKLRALRADADSQGLSEVEGADSESVSELLDEGNTFEAGVVQGVERSDDADEREVRTRELPEDDVPEEYLEKDE
jgi:hypothetical protein